MNTSMPRGRQQDAAATEPEQGGQSVVAALPGGSAPRPDSATARAGRPLRHGLFALLILALGVAVLLWLRATREVAVPEPPAEKVWPVQVVEVTVSDHQPAVTAFGEVVSGRTAELRPLVAGEVVALSPDMVEGGLVREGELLARIDPFDYELALQEAEAGLREARARLQEIQFDREAEQVLLTSAEAQLEIFERELARSRSLRDRGTVSAAAYDQAALSLENGRAAVATRRQAINRLQAQAAQQEAAVSRAEAAEARARRELERTRILAPFTAFVSAPQVAVGQRVGQGDSLAGLIDIDGMEVSFQLLNEDFARLLATGADTEQALVGRPLKVRWQLGGQSFEFPAVIAREAARLDAATGGVDILGRFVGLGPETPLRPGAFVQVALPDRVFPASIELPAGAVREDGVVYVIEDGRLAEREVRVLRRLGEQVLVEAALPDGARVVARAFPEIGPGVKVEAQ